MPSPTARSSRRADLADRKRQNQTQQRLLYAVIGIVAVLGVLIGSAMMKGGGTEDVDPGRAAVAAGPPPGGGTAAPGAGGVRPGQDPVRTRVEELLHAIQEGDRDVLARGINFPRWHDALIAQGKAAKRWAELDSLEQTLARQQIAESLVADDATRDFMRQSTIRTYVPKRQDADGAEVLVIQQHLIERTREQERNLELAKLDGFWFLVAMSTSPVQTPEEMKAVGDTARAAERAKRVNRDLAPIERQEPLADTPADVTVRIDAACAKLLDLSATKEATRAKRELAAIGKPAIPAVLNLIVGREELATKEDQMIVNNAVSVLKDITQEDLGYAPGGIGGTMTGDIKKENVDALMRWFGWWRDHKKSWTGPRSPASEN